MGNPDKTDAALLSSSFIAWRRRGVALFAWDCSYLPIDPPVNIWKHHYCFQRFIISSLSLNWQPNRKSTELLLRDRLPKKNLLWSLEYKQNISFRSKNTYFHKIIAQLNCLLHRTMKQNIATHIAIYMQCMSKRSRMPFFTLNFEKIFYHFPKEALSFPLHHFRSNTFPVLANFACPLQRSLSSIWINLWWEAKDNVAKVTKPWVGN